MEHSKIKIMIPVKNHAGALRACKYCVSGSRKWAKRTQNKKVRRYVYNT